MAKSAMPVSKAKTAYGLLTEIRKLILEEPKRYNQLTYVTWETSEKDMPACGTVCCVAGWVAALKGARKATREDVFAVPVFAQRRLGVSNDQADELFDMDAAGDRYDLAEHAQNGAEHIARFQKKYAKQLKAKKV